MTPDAEPKRSDSAHSNQADAWVPTSSLERSPAQRDALGQEQLRRIQQVRAVFADVDDQTEAEWVDNFRRDQNPDKEIAVWEEMASAYREFCSGRQLSSVAKMDVFRVVLMRSMASEEETLAKVQLNELTKGDARIVMRGFKSASGTPLDVKKR